MTCEPLVSNVRLINEVLQQLCKSQLGSFGHRKHADKHSLELGGPVD